MKRPKSDIYLVPILRPLARYCLKHSFYLQDIVEVLKRLMSDEAERILLSQGQKVNISRISALTGIHRKEIPRLQEGEVASESKSLISRILGQWQYDKRFTDGRKRPALLKLDSSDNSFAALVASVSTDLNPGTVLFELERLGLVKKQDERVKLNKSHHPVSGDTKAALGLLSSDIDDLISAVQTNLENQSSVHLHGRTEFDNVDPDSVSKIRNWLIVEGKEFHKRAREYLAKFDRDISGKKSTQPGVRVSVGTFSFDEQKKDF